MAALTAGQALPEPPHALPPSGSSKELVRLATNATHCSSMTELGLNETLHLQSGKTSTRLLRRIVRRTVHEAQKHCILGALDGSLRALRVDRTLERPSLLAARLATARECWASSGARRRRQQHHHQFTLLPAAVAASSGTMRMYGVREDLLMGGLRSHGSVPGFVPRRPHTRGAITVVPTVDLAGWLLESFRVEDFVVLKMDVEGAEHEIIPRLLRTNASRLVDVLLWECHRLPNMPLCNDRAVAMQLRRSGVAHIFREPYTTLLAYMPTRSRGT